MKKYFVPVACIFILSIILAGCESAGKDEVSFEAVVLENEGTSLLVEPVEGSEELRSADKIVVYLSAAVLQDSLKREITVDDIDSGDKVQIDYDGMIAESYPAQIHNCYRVILLD